MPTVAVPAKIRPATAEDGPFLAEMLVLAATWWEPGEPPPASDVLADGRVARYVDGWPRAGDVGVIADVGGQRLGAAWWRRFAADEPGYGFVDESTPELSIGVVASARGRGLGTQLLEALVAEARRRGLVALSLSVATDNPARRLYSRLGFAVARRTGASITMVRQLDR